MQWWEIRVSVPSETADALAAQFQSWPEVHGVLLGNGAVDGPPHPEFGEFLDDSLLTRAQSLDVSVYLPGDLSESAVKNRVVDALAQVEGAGLPLEPESQNFFCDRVDDSQWANVWEEEFQPVDIGNNWAIVPKRLRDSWPIGDSRIPIFLEPGRAFGTGLHATTQLCLEAFERHLQPGQSLLDIGCGTGILSIAAAKLGAQRVLAVDLDPVAVDAARENVADNGVTASVTVVHGDLLQGVSGRQFELVAANILRDPVLRLIPDAYTCLQSGGCFVSSGYLETDVPQVSVALAKAGFQVAKVNVKVDWASIVAVKTS